MIHKQQKKRSSFSDKKITKVLAAISLLLVSSMLFFHSFIVLPGYCTFTCHFSPTSRNFKGMSKIITVSTTQKLLDNCPFHSDNCPMILVSFTSLLFLSHFDSHNNSYQFWWEWNISKDKLIDCEKHFIYAFDWRWYCNWPFSMAYSECVRMSLKLANAKELVANANLNYEMCRNP